MAEDPHITTDVSEPVEIGGATEDAETTATRRELKQTSLSEKKAGQRTPSDDGDSDSAPQDKNKDSSTTREATPDTAPGDVNNEAKLRERVSSPKRKRAHDDFTGESFSKPGSAALASVRGDESEPEKKRPRDRESETRRRSQDGEDSSASSRSSLDQTSGAKEARRPTKGANGGQSQTSASAFASSGFAKLATSKVSPFGALGSGGPSLFGASSGSSGSFGVLGGEPKPTTSPAAPKLTFGGGSSSASPFAQALNGAKPSIFGGSAFGSGFGGSALVGQRLSTFGKPGEALKSDKPAKPFGAPESDAEDESEKDDDEESNDAEAGSDKEESKETDKDESKDLVEEKKRIRLHKIKVDDGESGEVTLLAVRAKMFHMEKGVGWKERGGGMLKINVPKSTIELDDNGNPDPTTFDASVLDEDSGEEADAKRNVRLIMRQDHTLRVILNTVVVPAMVFQLKQTLKASFILFTAFENGEPKQVQMKMSAVNATHFTDLVEMLKRQLSDV